MPDLALLFPFGDVRTVRDVLRAREAPSLLESFIADAPSSLMSSDVPTDGRRLPLPDAVVGFAL